MATAALRAGRQVADRFGGGPDTGMTAATTGFGGGRQCRVIHALRTEGNGRMACVAVVVGGNVVWRLALGDRSVVAAEATAQGGAVVDGHHGPEVVERMALIAVAGAGDVSCRFGCGIHSGSRHVAARAGSRCSLEYPADMAVLARQIAVGSQELEAGGEVVELRSLDSPRG